MAGYRRLLPKDWRFWIEDMRLCGERLELREASPFGSRLRLRSATRERGAGGNEGRCNKSRGTQGENPRRRARAKGRSKERRKRKGI